jgi:hypothetical protein
MLRLSGSAGCWHPAMIKAWRHISAKASLPRRIAGWPFTGIGWAFFAVGWVFWMTASVFFQLGGDIAWESDEL